jgi:Zn finger protein HypA/HybF involved in hydrogenase expression
MSVIILIAVVVAFVYYLSLRIHPMTRCKRCNPARRHYDLVYSERARHACPNCHGTGRQKRLGARLFIRSK